MQLKPLLPRFMNALQISNDGEHNVAARNMVLGNSGYRRCDFERSMRLLVLLTSRDYGQLG
jgi:hypothetical protein